MVQSVECEHQTHSGSATYNPAYEGRSIILVRLLIDSSDRIDTHPSPSPYDEVRSDDQKREAKIERRIAQHREEKMRGRISLSGALDQFCYDQYDE